MNNKKIAGIVCEYNPFHTGHKYQIDELRRLGYEKIVCVMSGNSVQRGELAILDKYSRAEAAVRCGADLVLELPYPYSSSGAEFFASAAVRILSDAGVGTLCFGSESADLDGLTLAAQICESDEFSNEYKRLIGMGEGSAGAYFEAYKNAGSLLGIDAPDGISGSNDLLGISYIRAIRKYRLDIAPVVIKRQGASYKDEEMNSEHTHPSALMIRGQISKTGIEGLDGAMPDASLEIFRKNIVNRSAPVDIKNIESAVLAFFRLADAERLSALSVAECGGGLCEKLCKCSKNATSYDELVEMAMGKNYTAGRVKRAILACMTGATEDDIRRAPSYSTVLSFNGKGREILAALRKKETEISFVSKPADVDKNGERQKELSEKLDSIFTLAKPSPAPSGEYIAHSPVII